MVKSIYLNYSEQVAGNEPYKFVVPLDETLKLLKGELVGLHNVEVSRPLIVFNEDQTFWIFLNKDNQLPNPAVPNTFTPEFVFSETLPTTQSVAEYTQAESKETYETNPYYRKLIPNIPVVIPKGQYSKNAFLEILETKANESLLRFFDTNLPQVYNAYKFAVVNDGEKVFLGLFNESKLIPAKINNTSVDAVPNIVNSNNMEDNGVTQIVVADFAVVPSNLAYPSIGIYPINTEISLTPDGNVANNWNTFAFLNSSVNLLSNKQNIDTDRQNSGLTFGLGFSDAGTTEYFVGFLSQAYQMTHWPAKNTPQTSVLQQLGGIDVPLAYCGAYFKQTPDGVMMYVLGTSNPYYAVDTFVPPGQQPEDGVRRLCYRNSVTPIEEMIVLYSSIINDYDIVKSKGQFTIEFYYRYSTNSKVLLYKNYQYIPEGANVYNIDYLKSPENFRLYFRVCTTNSFDTKTNNRVLFDSRSIDYYFSHEMLNDNYKIVNPSQINQPYFVVDEVDYKRDAASNTGIPNGMVPFLLMKNITSLTTLPGFYNVYMNATRVFSYESAPEIPQYIIDPGNPGADPPIPPITQDLYAESGYYAADLNDEILIEGKLDYIPLGIFSYGFTDMTEQISKVLGSSIAYSISNYNPKLTFAGFSPNRFPFDINAELGISTMFTEGNKYHIILKNIPLAALANIKDTGNAKRQNIVYTLRQSDANLTNVETNALTITHYPSFIKFLSMYNNNDVNINNIEVEIRNADTGKYADEITDCSLEILFSNS